MFVYWQWREAPALEFRMANHRAFVDGSAPNPFRYRLLGAFTAEGMVRALRPLLSERRAFHLAYLIWNAAWGFATFVLAERFFRRWHDAPRAVAGALLLGFSLVVGFAEALYAPFSVAEAPLFLAGVLAFLEARPVAGIVVVALATLNRETALHIPLAWAALSLPGVERTVPALGPPLRGRGALLLAGFLTWAAVYGGIRLVRGPSPPYWSALDQLRYNLPPGMLLFAALFLVLLAGPFWYLALRGLGRAAPELRRLALVALPIVALYLRFATWREVRVLMPLVPLLIALGLYLVPITEERARAD